MNTWNPFKKAKSAPKQSVDREFEREAARFNQLEVDTKKIYKDTKKHGEVLSELSKAEQRIFQNLASNSISQTESLRCMVEGYCECTEKIEKLRQELVARNQKTVVEPMKRFNGVFPSVNVAIKKREQMLQEYMKNQSKVLKLQEREKTPQSQLKLDAATLTLSAAKEDYERQNEMMLEELPKLIDGRIDYYKPCFEALVKSENSLYGQTCHVLADLSQTLECTDVDNLVSDEEYQVQLQQQLAELRALSIVGDE